MYQHKLLPYTIYFIGVLFISFHSHTTSCNVDQYSDPISYIMHLAGDDNVLSPYERIMLQRALQGNVLSQKQKEDVKNTLLRILHNENVSYNGMDQLYEAFDVGDHVKRNDSIVTRNSGLPNDTASREPRDPEQTIESEPITEPITLNEGDDTTSPPTGNFVEVPGDTMTGTLNFSPTADPAISGDQDVCFATDGTVRWCFTQEGGVEASLNSTAVNPGDSNLDSGVGFNMIINGDGVSQAESLATNSQSYGFNVAMGPRSQAITDDSSDAVNIAIHEGRTKGEGERANGFNFATRSALAASNQSKGFNFASAGGQAESFNDGDSFNFATGSSDGTNASATSNDGRSFNYAGPGGTARANSSFEGVNFATRDATAQGESAAGMNFAVGGGTSDCVGANSFNFAANQDALAQSRSGFHGFNFAGNMATAEGEGGNVLSSGFNFAAQEASIESTGNSGFNFAALNSAITANDASHGFNFVATNEGSGTPAITTAGASTTENIEYFNIAIGSDSSNNQSTITMDDFANMQEAVNIAVSGSTIDNDAGNGVNIAVGAGTLRSAGDGINMNSGTQTNSAMRVYTNDTHRWRFAQEGGVDASLNGTAVNPGDSNLDSGVGFNMIINGSAPLAQAESLANNAQSFGYNVAIGPETRATTDDGSAGFNFISAASIGSMEDSSGFNFAASSANTNISASSTAFNVAVGTGSEAIADNFTEVINMATDGGRADSRNRSSGFNFAGQATSITTQNNAHAFNVAVTSDSPADSIDINDGDDGNANRFCNIVVGSGSSLTINDTSQTAAINAIADGGTLTNPGNGVNIDPGSGEFRLFSLPAQDEDEVLTINSSTGVVGITPESDIASASTRQVKRDISSISDALQRLLETDPCEFRYRNAKDDGRIHYGMIAEELAHIMPELVRYDTNGEPSKIRYIEMVPLLVKHIQELRNIISQQHEEAICMQAEINENQRFFMNQLQQQQEEIAYLRSLCDA